MTIILVILAVLILLAVLFLIRRVNQVGNNILSAMMDSYDGLINHFTALENNIDKVVTTITTVISSQQEEVVKLTNKVEESNSHCKSGVDSLKHTILTLNDRITAPIDKINDTHNRIKTLSKSAASAEDLRTVVAEVVSAVVTEAVDVLSRKSPTKTKTVKKVDTELDKDLIKKAKA